MATSIDLIVQKWTAEAKRDHAELRRDLHRMKRQLLAASILVAGLLLAAVKCL